EDLADLELNRLAFLDLIGHAHDAGIVLVVNRHGLCGDFVAAIALVRFDALLVFIDLALIVIFAGADHDERFQHFGLLALAAVNRRYTLDLVADAFADVIDQRYFVAVDGVFAFHGHANVVVAERAIVLEQFTDIGLGHGGVVGSAEDSEDLAGAVDAVAEHGAADKLVAGELDGADANLGTFGDVEDDLGVVGIAALDEIATGEGPAVLVVEADDVAAGDLVGDRIQRHALADVGHLFQLIGALRAVALVGDFLHGVGV